jgi:GTPase SAR1 family protein
MCFGKKEKQAQIHIKGIKVSQKQIAAKKKVKLILCGNAAVGKTSITLRSQDGVFKKNQGPTITRAFQ